jgi:hypothetical protein
MGLVCVRKWITLTTDFELTFVNGMGLPTDVR